MTQREEWPVHMKVLPAHLRYVLTTRGTMMMPQVNTLSHGSLQLAESSAEGQFVWLRASAAHSLDQPHGDRAEAVLHVTLDQLRRFTEQCQFMLDRYRVGGFE